MNYREMHSAEEKSFCDMQGFYLPNSPNDKIRSCSYRIFTILISVSQEPVSETGTFQTMTSKNNIITIFQKKKKRKLHSSQLIAI